jgi:hypothetical protein
MADNADIMALMQGAGAPPSGGVAVGSAPPPMAPPMPTPMAAPEQKAGVRENALVNISMALDLIEQALPALGSESDEGKKALSALSTLTAILGPKKQKAGELQNAEILQLLQNLPQAGGGTPGSRAIAGGPPNLGLMNPPGAPPAPPAGGPAGAPPMPM